MWKGTFIALLLLPVISLADDWIQLPTTNNWLINPPTLQKGLRPQTQTVVWGVWVREIGKAPPNHQVWIDCGLRATQQFFDDQWSDWQPIDPDGMEWAVYDFICKRLPKSAAAGTK
jgi:hypothetical protein